MYEPALIKAIETGIFEIPFIYFNNIICIIFWGIFIFSVAIQILILKKSKRTITKFIFLLLLILLMILCEIRYQTISDWGYLFVLFEYTVLFIIAAGVAVTTLIYYIYKKIKNS